MHSWLGVMAALAALVLVAGLQANTRSSKVPMGGGNKTAPQGAITQQLVTELQTTKNLLQNADHDYQGHRARAVHHVGAAIHALLGQQNTQTSGVKNTTANAQGGNPQRVNPQPGNAQGRNPQGGNNPLPQAVSDAQLQKAIQQLQIIHQQMTTTSGKNHGHAAGHIQNAIGELNTALKIK